MVEGRESGCVSDCLGLDGLLVKVKPPQVSPGGLKVPVYRFRIDQPQVTPPPPLTLTWEVRAYTQEWLQSEWVEMFHLYVESEPRVESLVRATQEQLELLAFHIPASRCAFLDPMLEVTFNLSLKTATSFGGLRGVSASQQRQPAPSRRAAPQARP